MRIRDSDKRVFLGRLGSKKAKTTIETRESETEREREQKRERERIKR